VVITQSAEAGSLTLDNISKAAPLIHAQLMQDAEANEESIPEHLAHNSFDEYIGDLIHWCYTEDAKLEKKVLQQPTLAALSQKTKDKLLIPWQKLDVLCKYQTTLDNQLYKAMKALRDEQAWRLNSLEAIEPADDEADAA
jgi:hypothetical protein